MMTTTATPRVWVGCLGCYNAGRLVGEWFDATDAPEEMKDFQGLAFKQDQNGQSVLREHIAEGHEELWVFDHENFHGLLTGECSPAAAKELAETLASVDNPEAYGAYAQYVGRDYATPEGFEEAFCGEYDSGKDYAYDLAHEIHDDKAFESWPFTEIDWQHAWRELEMGDYYDVDTGNGTVWIFRSV